MLKLMKLLTLILFIIFSYTTKAQNFIMPNMPDSFQVKDYSLHFIPLDELKNLFLNENYIVNLNNLINFADSPKSFTRIINRPQNTPTFRNGMDTTGYAMNDGFWRYFGVKDNSIYYSGLNATWGVCNSPFNTTMYLEKPVIYMPLGIFTNNTIFDTSIINYPIFKAKSQFVSCDSAKLSGFFFSECQKLKSGKIVFELDTIDVYSVFSHSHDSIILHLPENGKWKFSSSNVYLTDYTICIFTKFGSSIPLAEISQNYSTLRFLYDKRLRTPTGVKTITQPKVNLFPNPVKDILNIEGIENTEMFLYDAQGRMVWEGINVHQIQMQYLSEGIYHLSIKTNSGFLMKKIVKE